MKTLYEKLTEFLNAYNEEFDKTGRGTLLRVLRERREMQYE